MDLDESDWREPIRVAMVQTELKLGDIDVNLSRARDIIDDMKGSSDLLIFPEMFSSGFAYDDLKEIAREQLEWLNGMIEGREFIAGDRFTLADVLLFGFLEFGATVGQPLDAKLENLQGWYTRVASRPSIEASKS